MQAPTKHERVGVVQMLLKPQGNENLECPTLGVVPYRLLVVQPSIFV